MPASLLATVALTLIATVARRHKTGAAGTSSTGHSNPRYATGGNATAHRTPTAGAVRAESACGNPPAPLA